MANNFYHLFLSILDIHAPLKRGSAKQRPAPAPWLSSKIKSLCKSVEAYYNSLVDETSHNPKDIWKTVNKVLTKDKARTFPCSATFNGEHLKKQGEVAEAFNNHIATISPKLANKIRSEAVDDHLQYLPADSSSIVPYFVFKKVDENLLNREINKLKCSKSPRQDRIPVKVIKDAVDIFAKPLDAISNSSMEEGVFTEAWKLAKITPIYKSGQKADLNNYKPISLLSVQSTLFQKIVHNQLSMLMKDNELFSKCQHGF